MSRKEIGMRFLPVVAFAIVTLVVVVKAPGPSWGLPLLGVQFALMVLSIFAWLPKKHGKGEHKTSSSLS